MESFCSDIWARNLNWVRSTALLRWTSKGTPKNLVETISTIFPLSRMRGKAINVFLIVRPRLKKCSECSISVTSPWVSAAGESHTANIQLKDQVALWTENLQAYFPQKKSPALECCWSKNTSRMSRISGFLHSATTQCHAWPISYPPGTVQEMPTAIQPAHFQKITCFGMERHCLKENLQNV